MRRGPVLLWSCLLLASPVLALGACSDDASAPPAAQPDAAAPAADGGPLGCADGFRALPDGVGCDPILPPADCAGSTRARIGDATCVAVTEKTCPTGMTFDAARGVCHDVVPVAACAGATREALGQTTCAPVGDCAAAFPPAGFAVLVDPTLPDASLDATHVRTIGAALAGAPAGGTIAIAAGTYEESLAPTRPVKLVGRCPSSTRIVSPAGASAPGLHVSSVAVEARGLSLEGHKVGALVEAKGSLVLESVVLEKNREVGIVVGDAGSRATLTRSVVRGTLPDATGLFGWGASAEGGGALVVEESAVVDSHEKAIGVGGAGSSAKITRSFVARTQASAGGNAHAIDVQEGGALELVESSVALNVGQGVAVDLKSTAAVTRSIVRDTLENPSGNDGHGVEVLGGSKVTLEDSVLLGNHEVALNTGGKGTVVEATRTHVVETSSSTKGGFGVAAGAQSGAHLTFKDGMVARAFYYGFFADGRGSLVEIERALVSDVRVIDKLGRCLDVQSGATMSARDSTVQKCGTDGVVVDGQGGEATFSADHLLVQRTSSTGVFGRQGGKATLTASAVIEATEVGVYTSNTTSPEGRRCDFTLDRSVVRATRATKDGVNGAGVVSGGTVHLVGTTLAGNHAFAAASAGEGAFMDLTGSVLRDSVAEPKDDAFGHGLVGLDHATLRLTDCDVIGNARVGAAFQNVSVVIRRSRITRNQVGLHVQGDSRLAEVPGAPDTAEPNEVAVTTDTRLDGNETKLGSGFVPLPKVSVGQ